MRLLKNGLIAVVLLLSGVSMFAQDEQPLGDVARRARASKPAQAKAAKVTTNDEVPSSDAAGGNLSAQKQHFCDELRRKKDRAAEVSCALLAIDMGPEYETLTAKAFTLGEQLCQEFGGRLPTNVTCNAPHGEEVCEENNLYVKFSEMLKTEMNALIAAEKELNAVRQERFKELDSSLPGWNKRTGPLTDPEERQRFIDIEEKYKPREEEKEKVIGQMRARGNRFLLDQALLENICEYGKSSEVEAAPAR